MTDRVSGFTVVLGKDIRIDDIEGIQQAIAHIVGVVAVEPIISSPESIIGSMRERRRILDELADFIKEQYKK